MVSSSPQISARCGLFKISRNCSKVERFGQRADAGIAPIEENLHLSRQLVKERFDVELIACGVRERSEAGTMPQNSR